MQNNYIDLEGVMILLAAYVVLLLSLVLNIYFMRGSRKLKKDIDEDYEKYKHLLQLYGQLAKDEQIKIAVKVRLLNKIREGKLRLRSLYIRYSSLLKEKEKP